MVLVSGVLEHSPLSCLILSDLALLLEQLLRERVPVSYALNRLVVDLVFSIDILDVALI